MGITNLYPRIGSLVSLSTFLRPFVIGSLDIFFVSGNGWETLSDDFWGDVPRLLCRWETPCLSVFASMFLLFSVLVVLIVLLTLCNFSYSVVKELPELESQFEERIQEAIKYVSTIDDFDELVNPRILAFHCLGPEPSLYVL